MTKKKILLFIMAFMLVLNHSVYYFCDDFKNMIQCSVIAISILCMIVYGKVCSIIKIKTMLAIIVYLMLNIVCLINVYDFSKIPGYIYRYLIFIPIMVCVLNRDLEIGYQILKYISAIVICIATASLVFWLLGSVMEIVSPNMEIVTSWGNNLREGVKGGRGYWGIYFQMQREEGYLSNYIYWRNCGVFCEAPAYALFLSIALSIEIFLNKRRNKVALVILVAAMLSTTSSAAILYLIITLAEQFWFRNLSRIKAKKLLIPIWVVGFAAAFKIVLLNKSNQHSVSTRFRDIIHAVLYFRNRPFMGQGYGFDSARAIGFTSSFFGILASGGIVFGCLFLIPVILGIYSFMREKYYTNTNVVYIVLTVYMIFFLIVSNAYNTFLMQFLNAFLLCNYKEFVRIKRKQDFTISHKEMPLSSLMKAI